MEKTLQIKITADGRIALDEIKAVGKAQADANKAQAAAAASMERSRSAQTAAAASTRALGDEQRRLASELDTLMKRIDSAYRETKRLEEGQSTLRRSYAAGLINLSQYKQGLASLNNETSQAVQSGERHASIIARVGHYAAAAFAVSQVVDFTKQIVQANLNFEKYNNTLVYATGSQHLAAVEMDYITRTADQLGLNLEGAIVGYTKFSAATRGTSIEGEKTREVFESIAKASVVMRLSADETNGALLAISQMISKGTVQAEELRGQLGERLPGAFNVAARAMGVTTQELDKLLEDGAVVSDEFLPRFADELTRTLGDNPQSAASSAQAQLNRLSNAYLEFKRSLGESLIMELVLRVTEGSTDALKWFNHFVFDRGELADLNARANAPERLAKLDRERQFLLEGGNNLDPSNTLARRQARLAAIDAEVQAIRNRAGLDTPAEEVGESESAKNAAALRDKAQQNALDKFINTEKWQTRSQKLASALEEERKAFEKLVEGMEKDSPRYKAAYEAHLSHIDVIKGKAEASAKKSNSDPLANAMRQLENARAESGRNTEKFIYDAELKALDTGLQQALISYREYYVQRETIEDDYYNRQVSRIEQKIANEQAAAAAARARGDNVGAAGNETNIVKLQSELNALDQQRANSRAANMEAERAANLEMARQGMAMTAQLLQSQGQLEDAARLQVAQKYSASLARMKAEGNEAGIELIEKLINVELASGRLNQIETELNASLARITDETRRVDIQKNAGILTEFEARRRLIGLQQQEIPLRQAQLTALEQAYQQSPTRELSDRIRQAQLDIEQLQAVVSGANRTFEYGARTAIGEYRDAISNGATQARDLFNSSFQSMENVLATFFQTGKLNMQDFFSALEQSLAKVAAQKMMEGIFGALDMGSWFGGSNSTVPSYGSSGTVPGGVGRWIGTNHTGGILGSESTALRYVSSDVFDGAPRFHSGGILGDEIPIIGRKGEGVFTAEQMKNLAPVGTGGQQVVNVQIFEAAGTQATVTQSTGDNGELNLQVMVETLTDIMGRDIERGRGLGPTLEAKYGLNPSAGALG
ncbi:tape measure protein [Methylobacillus flagellatus]|uniref:Uncharacterized protein n=1 Tax=Methylobacillus flagellatus (strain ATCC 51484 / DSM 6875 / VKM B-1610 / KT) TaxID=265072 RepID=Q1GXT5_METFK|nr:tape measure protein [Methylobacillus flagellatus]ABE50952.1 hypothetical protein Mfla_2689 [Methylobacillus flagellatus KT]